MDAEDLEPKVKAPTLKLLDPMSVGELEDYIAQLEDEIQRVKREIAAKRGVKANAEALFGRK